VKSLSLKRVIAMAVLTIALYQFKVLASVILFVAVLWAVAVVFVWIIESK
jgi:hypothetical protein